MKKMKKNLQNVKENPCNAIGNKVNKSHEHAIH